MSDQPKPATDCSAKATQPKGEWTVRPVHKNDGTVWPGIGYISDGNRTYGSANFEEGKAIVAAINAAIAAEREKVQELVDALKEVDYYGESLVARNYEPNSPTVIGMVAKAHAALAKVK
jgi:hypothetical protein